MTKIQKFWLSLFLAMFIIPELLWSPVGNFVYSWLEPLKNGSIQTFRDNFLMGTNNFNIYSFILFIQFLGIFLTATFLIIINKNIKNRTGFWLALILFVLILVITFFCFGLSISLRHIGF